MKDTATDPCTRRRLPLARYAGSHPIADTVHHFGCCWKTAQRVKEYDQTGTVLLLQNKPRGRPQHTPPDIKDRVIAIY